MEMRQLHFLLPTKMILLTILAIVGIAIALPGNTATINAPSGSSTTNSKSDEPVSYGGNNYGYSSPMAYLPAPPGKRPSCAGPSDTFCTSIDYYPTELIEYLIKRYSFDFKTLLQDESTNLLSLTSSTPKYSTGSVYIPIQAETSATNFTLPYYGPLKEQHYEPSVVPPYVGPYGNLNDDWWASRYIRPSGRRQQSVSSSYRVVRQASSSENSICPTTSQFIMPRAAVNTKGNWMYVVNLENNNQVTQLVRTEKCATTQCSGLCQVPAGFTATCTQQFVQKRLVALNGNGENLYTDVFWFPHCCSCQIRAN